jgi:hypothetical protein
MIKSTNSWSILRQTVEIYKKCQVSMHFSIWIKTFGTVRWCWDKIKISLSWLKLLDCWDKVFEIVSQSLNRESWSREIETPRLIKILSIQVNLKRLNFNLFRWGISTGRSVWRSWATVTSSSASLVKIRSESTKTRVTLFRRSHPNELSGKL